MKKQMMWTIALCGFALSICPILQAEEIDYSQEIAAASCSSDADHKKCPSGNCDYPCDTDEDGNCCEEAKATEEQKPAKPMRQSAAQKVIQRG